MGTGETTRRADSSRTSEYEVSVGLDLSLATGIELEESGTGFEGFQLDMTATYGAIESIQNQYRAICHPDGGMNAEGSAARLGYTALQGEPEFRLTRPEDIFDRVN